MIDESLGKNTKEKKIIKEQFLRHMEIHRRVKQITEDFRGKEVEVVNCRKKRFYWEADIKISYKISGFRLPVKVMNRILKREALNEQH